MSAVKATWPIELLSKKHNREMFQSGEPALDEFLKKHARQNAERGISRTFVALQPGSLVVAGYHTVRSGEVAFKVLPDEERRALPRYPVPVVHLARLAVSNAARGRGLGETLLMHALHLALTIEQTLGVYAVEVVAKTDLARSFYGKYGFRSLLDNPLHMYLSIKAVKEAFRD